LITISITVIIKLRIHC